MRIWSSRPGRVVGALLVALTNGCGGESDPIVPAVPTLAVVTRPSAQDTVRAALVQALVVDLREGATKLSGKLVRFEVSPPQDTSRRNERAAVVCGVSSPTCLDAIPPSTFAVDITDADGRADAVIRFGTVAGDAWVFITAPELGLRDSVKITVLPGAAARLLVQNPDSALFPGRQYLLRTRVVDRFGNVRTDPVTYSAVTSNVTIDASGRVTAGSVGRGRIAIRAGQAIDSAFVSVVPLGAVLGYRHSQPDLGSVVAINLDGSGYRVIAKNASHPRQGPNGEILVLVGSAPRRTRIHVVQPDGSLRRVSTSDATLDGEGPAHLSTDGWLYFAGYKPPVSALWRMRMDGSGSERLTFGYAESFPWPSPDGTRLVFEHFDYLIAPDLFDVRTRQVQELGIFRGETPAWSPDGKRIAYSDGVGYYLRVINADGSGLRSIFLTGHQLVIDWTADSQWIICTSVDGINLVNPDTAEIMTLAFGAGLAQPARLNAVLPVP